MKEKLIVIGLGYVGLPLAYNFAKQGYQTIGLDSSKEKIQNYKKGIDNTQEVGSDIKNVGINFTNSVSKIKQADYIFVTVPTPTISGEPDLKYIKQASISIGKNLKKGSIVIYESTVYPYCTEYYATPILEKYSKFKYNKDFYVGYSPERINPGDRIHTVDKMTKIVSGSNAQTTQKIAKLYNKIVPNIHIVSKMEIAEAAKILENSQRDVNIALINQFAMLYPKIPTSEVIASMNTKWNALNFTSGLVGGHCIAEDPNYFIKYNKERGLRFTLLEEGRNINESIPGYIVSSIRNRLKTNTFKHKKVLLKGITYKADVNDIRNSKAYEVYKYLENRLGDVDIFDPNANVEELKKEFDLNTIKRVNESKYDIIIYTVNHSKFKDDLLKLRKKCEKHNIDGKKILIYDVNSMFYLDKNKKFFNYLEL